MDLKNSEKMLHFYPIFWVQSLVPYLLSVITCFLCQENKENYNYLVFNYLRDPKESNINWKSGKYKQATSKKKCEYWQKQLTAWTVTQRFLVILGHRSSAYICLIPGTLFSEAGNLKTCSDCIGSLSATFFYVLQNADNFIDKTETFFWQVQQSFFCGSCMSSLYSLPVVKHSRKEQFLTQIASLVFYDSLSPWMQGEIR